MATGRPVFPGESEIDQLYLIQKTLGPLTPDQMELFLNNPNFAGLKFPDMSSPITLERKYYKRFDPLALELMSMMLQMDSAKRPSCEDTLKHAYFDSIREEGLPLDPPTSGRPRLHRNPSAPSGEIPPVSPREIGAGTHHGGSQLLTAANPNSTKPAVSPKQHSSTEDANHGGKQTQLPNQISQNRLGVARIGVPPMKNPDTKLPEMGTTTNKAKLESSDELIDMRNPLKTPDKKKRAPQQAPGVSMPPPMFPRSLQSRGQEESIHRTLPKIAMMKL